MELRTDKYLRHVTDFPRPGIGLVVEDLISKTPHPEICRSKDTSISALVELFRRDSLEILAKGAAVGVDPAGLCRHVRPGLKGFLGFCEKNLGLGRLAVTTQGAYELTIPGLSSDSVGKTVFALGPDEFNVDGEGLSVGKILYLCERPGKAMVAFQRFDSPKKSDLFSPPSRRR